MKGQKSGPVGAVTKDPVQSSPRGPKAPEGQGAGGPPAAGGGSGGAFRGGHRGSLRRGRGDPLAHNGSRSGEQGRQPTSRPCYARPKTASTPTEDWPQKPHPHPTDTTHRAPGDEQLQGDGGNLIPKVVEAHLS